jgi:DNA segregation ATPase FtsK/SpoIIIE, S-DNA-T family
MATQTRGRTSVGSAPPRRQTAATRQGDDSASRLAALKRLAWGERRKLISRPVRLQIAGSALLFLALMSGWILISRGQDGQVAEWGYRALTFSTGSGAFLFPLFIGLAGLRAFKTEHDPFLTIWQWLGGVVVVLSMLGLLALSAPTGSDARPGGVIGYGAATPLERALGEVGTAFLLFGLGSAAVFLVTRTEPRALYRDLKALLPDIESWTVSEEPEEALPATPPVREESPKPKAATKPATHPPGPPVINFPMAATEPSDQASRAGASAVVAGEKLPLPDIADLCYYEGVTLDASDLEAKARLIESTLTSFKVDAFVREINPGPAVTQFTLEPGTGVKVRRITELQNDLALALAAPSIRIEAPVPGMARVGLEIPNEQVATVGLRETLESPQYARSKAKLGVPLGRDVNGRYVIHDLTKMPHLLIAGATGSGKSVCLNGIISTFLLTKSPDELRMLMIDPKMVELTGYNGVPHLQCPVITEMDKVVGALRLVVQEMQRRYDLFSKAGVRNLDGYLMKIEDESRAERVPYLVVILDELADLMLTSPVEVESLIQRLTQMGRAAGIHLIIATQRPSVDVLTGVIKANVPTRIAFAVASLADSRVVLDMPGAERLLGRGDMLFLPPDAAKPVRIQGAMIEDSDVRRIVDHWHAVTPIPHYAQKWLNLPSNSGGAEELGEDDPLMERALEVVREQGTASASMLQRKLRIGYNRAARLIEQMEDEGIIGPADGIRGRPVLDSDY